MDRGLKMRRCKSGTLFQPSKQNPGASKGGFFNGWMGGGNNAPRPAPPVDDNKTQNRDDEYRGRKSESLPRNLQVPEANDREQVETRIIKMLVESYYHIVRKNIQDTVPKAIMHMLVNKAKNDVYDIIINLYKDENEYENLLEENKEVATNRQKAQDLLKQLHQASEIISKVKNLTPEALQKGV